MWQLFFLCQNPSADEISSVHRYVSCVNEEYSTLVPSTTSLKVRRRFSSMNVFTLLSLMFNLSSLNHLNHLKTVAFFIYLVCWALCIVLYVSVAEYPKLKQTFTAARDSSFSEITVLDAVCKRCTPFQCTLNALYTSHDVRINVKNLVDVTSITDNISRNFAKQQVSKSCQVILTLL